MGENIFYIFRFCFFLVCRIAFSLTWDVLFPLWYYFRAKMAQNQHWKTEIKPDLRLLNLLRRSHLHIIKQQWRNHLVLSVYIRVLQSARQSIGGFVENYTSKITFLLLIQTFGSTLFTVISHIITMQTIMPNIVSLAIVPSGWQHWALAGPCVWWVVHWVFWFLSNMSCIDFSLEICIALAVLWDQTKQTSLWVPVGMDEPWVPMILSLVY